MSQCTEKWSSSGNRCKRDAIPPGDLCDTHLRDSSRSKKPTPIDEEWDQVWLVCGDYGNTIDEDAAPDGSEGGYDRHGNFIPCGAMQEIIALRKAKVNQR